MSPEQFHAHFGSIEEVLDEFHSHENESAVNARLQTILSEIGPINCDMVQEESIKIRAYELWRRIFKPKQLGNHSTLKTAPNSTKLLFINHGFFLDIGSNKDRNILFLAYSTLNKTFLNTLLESIKTTPLHQKLINSTFNDLNIIEYVLQHLQARVDQVINIHNNDLELKKGSIHKTKQGISFANSLIHGSQELFTEEAYSSYTSLLLHLKKLIYEVQPPVGRGRQSSISSSMEYSSKFTAQITRFSEDHQQDYTTNASMPTAATSNEKYTYDFEDTSLSESQNILEISPANKRYQLDQYSTTQANRQLFANLTNEPLILSEEDKTHNWELYGFALCKQIESTRLDDCTVDLQEQYNPMLQPAEYRILPPLPLGPYVFTPSFCSTRKRLPDIPEDILNQIVEQKTDVFLKI